MLYIDSAPPNKSLERTREAKFMQQGAPRSTQPSDVARHALRHSSRHLSWGQSGMSKLLGG